jgi:peptide/nickel transport system permease protein
MTSRLAAPELAVLEEDEPAAPEVRRRILRRVPPSLIVGMGVVSLLVLIAIFGPLLAPYDPINGDMTFSLDPPSPSHFLGTDLYGRDVFTRILYGSRIALSVGVGSVAASMVIGTILGMMAGYFSNIIETIVMRVVDVVISFPYIVLVITVLAVLGSGLLPVAIAIIVVDWTTYARLMHSQVLSVREREFVLASTALGASPWWILRKQVLPNVVTPSLVYASLDVSQVILLMAALSFLGLGAQPPTPDWGYMINEGRTFIYAQWWISTFPGIAVMLTGLAFGLLGDGLADAMDVRLR